MGKMINPQWQEDIINKIKEGKFTEVVVEGMVATWLVKYMASKGISCRIINMGCGVKKVTLATDICPHCKGTGKV